MKSFSSQSAPESKSMQLMDYSERKLFIGIDVHKTRWQVAVLCEGIVLSNASIAASADELIAHLHKHYAGADYQIVYECGAWGFTLCRQLWAAGMECMLVNPSDIPGTDRERRSKTDPIDARRMAKALESGMLHSVYVPTEKEQKQRSLIRYRKKLWADLVRAKNRLKSELKFQGITLPEKYDKAHWSRNFLQWIAQQAAQDIWLKDTLNLMLEQVQLLRKLLLKTELQLRTMMRQECHQSQVKLLQSIPGIGPLVAALFLLEIGDIRRFKTFDQLNRFIGFCPDSNSSGEHETHTGISVRRHKSLRSHLVEAAWMAIRKDPAMMAEYLRLCKRMKGHKAAVRIARKLLRRIRAVLLSQKMYVIGVTGNVTAKQVDAPGLPSPKVKGRPKKVSAPAAGHHDIS
jgi:transposase